MYLHRREHQRSCPGQTRQSFLRRRGNLVFTMQPPRLNGVTSNTTELGSQAFHGQTVCGVHVVLGISLYTHVSFRNSTRCRDKTVHDCLNTNKTAYLGHTVNGLLFVGHGTRNHRTKNAYLDKRVFKSSMGCISAPIAFVCIRTSIIAKYHQLHSRADFGQTFHLSSALL